MPSTDIPTESPSETLNASLAPGISIATVLPSAVSSPSSYGTGAPGASAIVTVPMSSTCVHSHSALYSDCRSGSATPSVTGKPVIDSISAGVSSAHGSGMPEAVPEAVPSPTPGCPGGLVTPSDPAPGPAAGEPHPASASTSTTPASIPARGIRDSRDTRDTGDTGTVTALTSAPGPRRFQP